MTPLVLSFGAALSMLAVAGCANVTASVRRRAEHDLACPAFEIAVIDLGAGGRRAIGCGRQQDYTCVDVRSEGRVFCTPDTASVVSAPAAAPPPPRPGAGWSELQVLGALEGFRDPLMSCVAASSLVLGIDFTPEGTVSNVQFVDLSEGARDCVRRTLAMLDIPGSVELAGHVNVTITRPAGGTSGGSAPSTGPAAPPPDPALEGRVRALVDSRTARILSCVGAPSVAVVVRWSADGAVTATVRGGTEPAVDACVAAALADVTVWPAPGVAGSLLHSLSE